MKMGWKAPIVAIGLAFGPLLNQSVDAAFIKVGTPQFGPDSVVVDTNTGLEWLNLDLSRGLSVDQVLTEQGGGGQFAGFRYATGQELGNLFQEFFAPVIPQPNSYLPVDTSLDFINLFGATFGLPFPDTGGVNIGQAGKTAALLVTTLTIAPYPPGPETLAYFDTESTFPTGTSPAEGSWLVRSVPEPASLVLLGAGITALLVSKWRKERL